jgi:hypothetical protein
MPTDTIVWEEVRRVYDDHSIPIAKICDQFGITRPELTKARNDLGWTPRLSATDPRRQLNQLVPDGTDAAAAAPVVPFVTPKRLPPLAQRRALVIRLTAVIEAKLAILERRFDRELKAVDEAAAAPPNTTTARAAKLSASATASAAVQAERDQRAISLIIKNLELVREYGNAPQPGPHLRGAAAKSASLAATQLADEADRIRRELGDRLSRLVEAPGSTTQSDPASA